MEIKDSGNRKEFETGAVRDISEGKGRCDLLPLATIAPLLGSQEIGSILYNIDDYLQTGDPVTLYNCLIIFAKMKKWNAPTLVLEVSKHYEEGAIKYGEHNWEKGIPLHSYIDSAVRHLMKYVDNQEDEPHDRAFVWNILGALWTQEHCPDMVDLKFPKRIKNTESGECEGRKG